MQQTGDERNAVGHAYCLVSATGILVFEIIRLLFENILALKVSRK
jgi:hypothetical protein